MSQVRVTCLTGRTPSAEPLPAFLCFSWTSYRQVTHLMAEALRGKACGLRGPPVLAQALSTCPWPTAQALPGPSPFSMWPAWEHVWPLLSKWAEQKSPPHCDLAVPASTPDSSCVFALLVSLLLVGSRAIRQLRWTVTQFNLSDRLSEVTHHQREGQAEPNAGPLRFRGPCVARVRSAAGSGLRRGS